MDTERPASPEESWYQYRIMVLGALERIDGQMIALGVKIDTHDGLHGKEIADMRVQIGMLKVQSAAWAAVAGVVVSTMVAMMFKLAGH